MRRGTNDDEQIAGTRFIDTQADTQSEPAQLTVDAGIGELQVLYQDGKVSMPVFLTIQTSTGLHRGVHMSRLVHAAGSRRGQSIEEWLRAICAEVNRTQPGARASCRLEVPYSDQFIPVTISRKEKGAVRYHFTAKGMTACPCSKKMIGIGHMQRAEIIMVIDGKKPLDMMQTIEKMEECFSAVPMEKMKRVDEAKKILEAQENTRFAEDLVRECVKRFPNPLYVRARCFESIHAHDAVATWSKKEDWVPAL
jgi:GTP cyclohydrolase FolE2